MMVITRPFFAASFFLCSKIDDTPKVRIIDMVVAKSESRNCFKPGLFFIYAKLKLIIDVIIARNESPNCFIAEFFMAAKLKLI